MQKIVLTYGLIAGAIVSALMGITLSLNHAIGLQLGMVIGYASMVLAFLLIYFGVRSYRDTVAGGSVGFGRALTVGALIGLIASLCYVAAWEVAFFSSDFGTRFIESYQAAVIQGERENGASEQALARKQAELEEFAVAYRNPAINAAYTFMEPLPVAIIIALVTAGVVSRKKKPALEGGDTSAQWAVT
jgi:hypothetical protein